MMTEEQVTKAILQHLESLGWAIVTFDFPQSGTGKMLHPDGNASEKNKGGIIPDIVAVKDGVSLFFENKDRTVADDFRKLEAVGTGNAYRNAIAALLNGFKIHTIYYGVGLPYTKWKPQHHQLTTMVNFVVGVKEDMTVEWLYNPNNIR